MAMNAAFSLAGQSILITGASSGIGRACAVASAASGARVILLGRNEAALRETYDLMIPNEHLIVPFDLLQMDQIDTTLQTIVNSVGSLSGLVHCAGAHMMRPLRMLSVANVHSMMDMNVTTALMLTKGFRQKGISTKPASLVLLSSVVGQVGQPGIVPYAASKGALLAAVKSLAVELAPEHIRVNAILPGVVETPMTMQLFEKMDDIHIDQIKAAHPLGLGESSDVAYAATYLLSPAARWITGTHLIVDGGYTAV